MATSKRQERKQKLTRIIALAIAGVMVLSVLLAALLSRMW